MSQDLHDLIHAVDALNKAMLVAYLNMKTVSKILDRMVKDADTGDNSLRATVKN